MNTTENKTLTEIIIQGLRTAASELEEFQLQIALGKAEAKDLFEDVKKQMKDFIRTSKNKYHTLKDAEILKLINFIEHLEVQLTLGLAETKETFEEQRKEINRALNQVEAELKANTSVDELKAVTHLEIEKFRMKLELLALHYKLKKISAEFNFEQKKQELSDKLEILKGKMFSAEQKKEWRHFKKEIGQAYAHFKQTFES